MKRYLAVIALTTRLCCSCRQNPTVSNPAPNPVTNNPSRGTNLSHELDTNEASEWIRISTNDRPIIHVLTVSNCLEFNAGSYCYSMVVCVDSNQWRILTNAYPTNFYQREIQFEK